MMTDTILSTALGGALQRRPDGWYWRDGTPEPRVRDMLLNDIAPNFRVMKGAAGALIVDGGHDENIYAPAPAPGV